MISFIHRCDETLASYRYRASIPARELGASMNDLGADVLVFAKPMPEDVADARAAKESGRTVIVDYCDPHFKLEHYPELLDIADAASCPTETMRGLVEQVGAATPVYVVPDPYEYDERLPHCFGVQLLWFGHKSNLRGLFAKIRELDDYPLMIVSNHPMAMPWSPEEMRVQFAAADIVVLPESASHKSPNRAVEAIRQGCFVVAEPHPALAEFPGIWIGNLKEGIEWTRHNTKEANQRLQTAQTFVRERFSPQTQADAWRSLFATVKSRSTSAAGRSAGPVGSTSMDSATART